MEHKYPLLQALRDAGYRASPQLARASLLQTLPLVESKHRLQKKNHLSISSNVIYQNVLCAQPSYRVVGRQHERATR